MNDAHLPRFECSTHLPLPIDRSVQAVRDVLDRWPAEDGQPVDAGTMTAAFLGESLVALHGALEGWIGQNRPWSASEFARSLAVIDASVLSVIGELEWNAWSAASSEVAVRTEILLADLLGTQDLMPLSGAHQAFAHA